MIYSLKVEPYSEAEKYFMKLLHKHQINESFVTCRLGVLFGKPYNEYLFDEYVYNPIRDSLRKKNRDF